MTGVSASQVGTVVQDFVDAGAANVDIRREPGGTYSVDSVPGGTPRGLVMPDNLLTRREPPAGNAAPKRRTRGGKSTGSKGKSNGSAGKSKGKGKTGRRGRG